MDKSNRVLHSSHKNHVLGAHDGREEKERGDSIHLTKTSRQVRFDERTVSIALTIVRSFVRDASFFFQSISKLRINLFGR